MLIRIDVNSEETLYSQLSNQIKYGIAKGYLKPGEALPSVRGLAAEIGINMHTVSKAYSLLKDEGIIIINRSSGVKVNEKVFIDRNNNYQEIFENKIVELISESICHGISQEQLLKTIKGKSKEIKGTRR